MRSFVNFCYLPPILSIHSGYSSAPLQDPHGFWTAIDRAERQLERLGPGRECTARRGGGIRIKEWKELQDAVKPFFSTKYIGFLEERATDLRRELEIAQSKLRGVVSVLEQRRRDRDELIAAISTSDVGPRLQAIDREIEVSEGARQRAQLLRNRIQSSVALLDAVPSLVDEALSPAHRPIGNR